jgi:hypothetical protein
MTGDVVRVAMDAYWDYRLAGRTLHAEERMEAALRAAALQCSLTGGAELLTKLNNRKGNGTNRD